MYRLINSFTAAILIFCFISATAIAGGFHISVKKNSGESSSYAKNVLLVVQPFGCHKPTDAQITGTAEGIVNGSRKTIELKFQKNSNGESTLTKQWPDEGVWVLSIQGAYNDSESSALVELGTNYNLVAKENSSGEPEIKTFHKKLSVNEVESALKKQLSTVKKV